MKKIFRMALVFALAGATLMYTGCTKDYWEDINSLENKVDTIQKDLSDKIADLQGKVATLSQSVSTLEGTLKTLNGDVSDLKTRVKTLEDAVKNLNKYATKDELNAAIADLEGKIAQAKSDILAVTDDLQTQLNELKDATEEQIAELQAALDEVYAALGDGLTSIVFIPDFYYLGVEATSYDFLDLYPHKAVMGPASTKDHNGTAVEFPATAKITFKADSTKKFTLGQIGIANYDINPSTFPLDSASWALHGMDRDWVLPAAATKSEAKTWKPIFEGISYKTAANGIPYAEVNYTIENPELLVYVDNKEEKLNVPVMQLEATLGDGKFVSSDWEAVVSGTEEIAHLAFAKANAYKTAEPEQCDTTAASLKKDLYYRADTCAQHIPSIEVKYNGGPIDLEPLVVTHINNPLTGIKEYSLEDLNAKYPGFTYKFELVPFTSGENVTGEEYYGKIDGSEFTPCWVASEGGKPVSKPIAKDSEDGLSSVGRTPIVLVTLINAEKVVAYGYFKVVIAKDPKEPETKELGPVDFGKVPFVCEPITMKITWYDFSHFVLENLKMDYDEFTATYTFDEKSAYVKKADGTFEAVGDKYGPVVYNKDTQMGTINDVFEWTVDPQKIGEGKSQTIYLRFTDANEMSILFFELTANVAAAAKFDFGANKLKNEWYDDIKGEYMNTARVNVPVPVADKTDPVKGGDVTKFQRDLNHFFVGYKPGIELAADADSIYLTVADSLLETTATYTFSAAQDKIVDWDGTEFQLFTNATFDSLFVKAKFNEDGKVVPDATAKADTTTLIAYLTSGESEGTDAEGNADAEAGDETTGGAAAEEEEEEANIENNVIVYSWAEGNTLAKYFLNLWGLNDNEKDETMLHANVTVDITYGECKIPAGKENFHVRFIRPLDINFQGQGINEESAVDGANVEIAKFINGITDWNHQRVIVPEKDSTGAETGYYTANVIKTVDMYAYYQFDSLIINIGLAERDNWNVKDTAEYKAIKDVTPAVKLQLGTLDEDEVFTAMTPDTDEDGNEFYAVAIDDFDAIKDLVINYRNDEAYVEAFNIRIPIKIGYAWGYYVAYFEINILDTGSTTPKKPAR